MTHIGAVPSWLEQVIERHVRLIHVSSAQDIRCAYEIEFGLVSDGNIEWRFTRARFPDWETYLGRFRDSCELPMLFAGTKNDQRRGFAYVYDWRTRDHSAWVAVCSESGTGTIALLGAAAYLHWYARNGNCAPCCCRQTVVRWLFALA